MMSIRQNLRELYDQPKGTLCLKARMVKADALKPYCMDATVETPTCVAPRHVDAPRDFIFIYFYFLFFIFSPNEQRAEGGGAARLFLFLFFSVQQTTSGIGHRVK